MRHWLWRIAAACEAVPTCRNTLPPTATFGPLPHLPRQPQEETATPTGARSLKYIRVWGRAADDSRRGAQGRVRGVRSRGEGVGVPDLV